MPNRFTTYFVAFLVAVIASIVPAAIYADLMTPVGNWGNVYWEGQPHPRPQFTMSNLPLPFRVEIFVFKVLVVPPGWISSKLTGYPTVYSANYVSRIIYETAGIPPLFTALNHLKWALPFWFLTFAIAFEIRFS